MRRLVLLAAGALLAALLLPLTPVAAGAGGTTDVYLVHGLNLESQEGPGGSAVTVCAGDARLVADFQFGDTAGPLALPTGIAVDVTVYLGGDVDCADPGATPSFTDSVTPEGDAVAVVATAEAGERVPVPVLQPFPIDVGCVAAGQGRLTGNHAALAPAVDVLLGDAVVGQLSFGEQLGADLPVGGGYEISIEAGGSVVLGPIDLSIFEAVGTNVFVVGGLPASPVMEEPDELVPVGLPTTPFVALTLDVELALCDTPLEPTTTSTAAAAAAAAATPRFTG